MMEFLESWALNITVMALFIVILEILIPTGKIKKFINLVSGFILIIAIINPFINFLKDGIDLKEFQINDSSLLDRKEIEVSSRILEDKQMKQIVEVYRKKIINQIENSTKGIAGDNEVKADVIINEDYNSDSFGEVKSVYLYLKPHAKEAGAVVKPVEKVQKIEVGKENDKEGVVLAAQKVDSALKTKLEEKINKLLDVQKENIVVALQEK